MFKVMVLLKRKPGMSMEDFINYYETRHAVLGVKYQTKMIRYARHYLHPTAEPLEGGVAEPEYDVLTEICFADRAAYEEGMALLREPEINAALIADEENLFDRRKNRLVFVEERESVLPWVKS